MLTCLKRTQPYTHLQRSVEQRLKGNAQFVQKVTFEPLMDFKQNHH